VNLGSQHATSRYLFLLNPDTKLVADTIDGLADFLESHPDAGAVSPKIVDKDGIQALFSVRQFPSVTNAILRQFGLRRLLPGNRFFGCETLANCDRGRLMVVPCVSGAAIMLPRSVFEAVGRLSEDLPMYFEDLELCARVGRIAPIYYLPGPTVVHLGRKSVERSPSRSVLVAMENGEAPWMYLRRHSGRWHARAFSATVLIGSVARVIVRGGLVLFAALLGRTHVEPAISQVADAAALLKWCVLPRRIFLSLVNSVFASGQDASTTAKAGC
jgi:GT2 family glycosyltransferase